MARNYVAIADNYAKRVILGKIPACKWVKAACQRQQDDRKRWRAKTSPFSFSKAKASAVCQFIEYLPHVKGPLAKQEIILEPWQIFVLTTVFGWLKVSDGKRRFRRSYIEVPRGNGKSAISSGVGLFMLAADGEMGAEVYSLATTRDQARIVFGDAQQMVRLSPDLRRHYGIEIAAHNINILTQGSKFEPLSAEGSTLDGLNIHLGIIDELHAHKTRTVYDVVETGTGKRDQSLLWVITTAGSDRSGICYEVRDFVTKVLDRVIDDDSQFGIIYGLDDDDAWASEDALKKANPNWGVSVRPEVVLPLMAKALQMASATNNFLTKHLNVWVSSSSAWMDMRAWDRCADLDLDIDGFAGEPCYIGLDLATRSDIAAQVQLFTREIDGLSHFYVFGHYYLPEEAVTNARNSQYGGWARAGHLTVTDGNVTDYSVIADYIRRDAASYEVKEVGFDPWNSSHLVNILMEEGMTMVEMRQGARTLSEPMKHLEALVMSKRLHHNGNPALTWMLSNVMAKTDENDNIRPIKEREENKIDGAVALIMALGRAMAFLENSNMKQAFVEL